VTTKTGVAIIGASGYAARELIRILLNHPDVTITVATSRQDEAPRLDSLHPSLARRIDLTCDVFDADRVSERASLAFLALPHTASMAVTPALRQRGMRVIDLSADYRLTDPESTPIGMAIRILTRRVCVALSMDCRSSSAIAYRPWN